MTFADVTIVPVPADHRDAYVEFPQRMADVYLDHGAISVTDYWQVDDSTEQQEFHAASVTYGANELRGIARAVNARSSECLVVSVIEWPSQEERDRGTAAATRDPRIQETLTEEPVFDGRRLMGNSFEVALIRRRHD
ncbi:DUF1428 domain-containing protein [Naumannella halotolerans]|uniref:DUF1428 domain-containing protein n=1 Tax=Naumannella halotolerans TaxID=993414 RepID=UPI00370D74FD